MQPKLYKLGFYCCRGEINHVRQVPECCSKSRLDLEESNVRIRERMVGLYNWGFNILHFPSDCHRTSFSLTAGGARQSSLTRVLGLCDCGLIHLTLHPHHHRYTSKVAS